MQTFDDFTKMVKDLAIDLLKSKNKVLPQLMASDEKGKITVAVLMLPMPLWKEMATAVVYKLKAVYFAIIADYWYIERKKGEMDKLPVPEEQPDRKEALSVIAYGANGEHVNYYMPYEKTEKGIVFGKETTNDALDFTGNILRDLAQRGVGG